jgi:hypothetical protein
MISQEVDTVQTAQRLLNKQKVSFNGHAPHQSGSLPKEIQASVSPQENVFKFCYICLFSVNFPVQIILALFGCLQIGS